MEEQTIDEFRRELLSSENPEKVLAKFYWKLQSTLENKDDINLFRELVELFGRAEVFFLILDVVGYYGKEIEHSRDKKKIFLRSMRMRLERKFAEQPAVLEDLSTFISERKEAIEKHRRNIRDRG
jgi:hypothetical protein